MRYLVLLLVPFFLSPPAFPPDMAAAPCVIYPAALNRFQIRDEWKKNNKRWFLGKLPELKPDNVYFADMKDFLATVTCSTEPRLTISTKIQFSDLLMRQVLLHEMAHVSSKDCVHGPYFQREMRRLVVAGAWDELL